MINLRNEVGEGIIFMSPELINLFIRKYLISFSQALSIYFGTERVIMVFVFRSIYFRSEDRILI